MALALRAAFGVRGCSPANAVAKRYPGPSDFAFKACSKSRWVTRRILRLALRAIGYADVRYGILPAQSGFRRNDERR